MTDLTQTRLILAPLMGASTASFRSCQHQLFGGFDEAVAPFVSITEGAQRANKAFRDLTPKENQGAMPLVPQFLGKDGKGLAAMAQRLHLDFGYQVFNLNIACPKPTVTARRRGAGILPYPDMIASLLDMACANSKWQLSVKMRLGMSNYQEGLVVGELLNDYPIKEVQIHARLAVQQYTGHANVDAFANIKQIIRHPVVYNGDLRSVADCVRILNRFPDLAGLMIGRASVYDPGLAARIKSPKAGEAAGDSLSPQVQFEQIARLHDRLMDVYLALPKSGPSVVLGRMKELAAYWQDFFAEAGIPAKNLLKAHSLDEYHQTWHSLKAKLASADGLNSFSLPSNNI